MYSALQRMNVPTRLLIWPDENHWILKGENSRVFYREVRAWLEKYLLPAVAADRAQPGRGSTKTSASRRGRMHGDIEGRSGLRRDAHLDFVALVVSLVMAYIGVGAGDTSRFDSIVREGRASVPT